MYFAAKKLGRYQSADRPTTAMTRAALRMRRRVLASSMVFRESPPARVRSRQRDVLGIVLLFALELQEVVVAAAGCDRVVAAHAWARFVHGAAPLFLIEKH